MNYQLLLECYSSGTTITKLEADLLDLELYTQVEIIKVSPLQGCLEIAPDHICDISCVCKGSFWITCLAALLDHLSPTPLRTESRSSKVLDALIKAGYVATDYPES